MVDTFQPRSLSCFRNRKRGDANEMNLEKGPRASQYEMGWKAPRTFSLLPVAEEIFLLTLPFIERAKRRSGYWPEPRRDFAPIIVPWQMKRPLLRRFPRTAYLHADRPEQFTRIVGKLMERWPDCRPYRGAFTEINPHLTVADEADSHTLDMVQRRVAGHLPITYIAREAWLLYSNHIGFWSRNACFQFLPTEFDENVKRRTRQGVA
jgi:hypothetical protein